MYNPTAICPTKLPSLPLDMKEVLPGSPGIYFVIDKNDVIQYIGRSQNLHRRWQNHHLDLEFGALEEVRIAWLAISDPTLLIPIESALISYFCPQLNKALVKRDQEIGKSSIKWRLAALMADRGINYKQMAELTGLHEGTVSKHKNSYIMPERLERETLVRYCLALNCQPGDLLVYIRASTGNSEE
jgi:putative transcriptional regulator